MPNEKLLQPRVSAVSWKENACVLLDQTRLPKEELYLVCKRYEEVVQAIQTLAVRGAPALGVAGAYGCVLAFRESQALAKEKRLPFLNEAFAKLENARPTAVNLKWAVGRMRSHETFESMLAEATKLHEEDIACNQRIATLGAQCLPAGAVLTCCNTGDLATGGIGTAFGVIREGFRQGKIKHVYACETRPVLQGMRLTTWELEKNGIPFTLVCDNMVGSLMAAGKVASVITGADRIVANGDAANKIGTYQLAVLAKHHAIPFFIAAPFSTFDMAIKSGANIPIETRSSSEVLDILGDNSANFEIPVYNPAFDVTPNRLMTAIISDRGVIESPARLTEIFEIGS